MDGIGRVEECIIFKYMYITNITYRQIVILAVLVRLQPGSAEQKMAAMSEPLHLERGKGHLTSLICFIVQSVIGLQMIFSIV